MTAFIFDIDGTIIDSMRCHERSWDIFLARRGVPTAGEDFFRRTAGRTGTEVMRELFGALTEDEARERVREKEAIYRELFAAEFREIAGFTGFARTAKALGVRLACATAGDADNIAFAVGGLGLSGFFDATVGAHDVARGKPEPDLFLLAAERIGARPAECLVFEDAPLGIEGARRAGMLAVGITSGEPAERLSGPHVLSTIPDYRAVRPRDVLDLARAARSRAGERA
jgi:beta-phosphoglucomutase-like phosphatase (HAD superfamily)